MADVVLRVSQFLEVKGMPKVCIEKSHDRHLSIKHPC